MKMINKLLRILNNPRPILLRHLHKHANLFPDKIYLRLKYYLATGHVLNLRNPHTFNEKMQWLKIYDRKQEYTNLVDKYSVKEWVKEKIGEEYVIPNLGVWDNFDDINFDLLPDKFVLKTTHGAGSSGVVICSDKSRFNKHDAKLKLEKSLLTDTYCITREWPYKNIPRRIIAEQFIEDKKSNELTDYKLMCFNGEVKCTFTCTDRFSDDGLRITIYDRDWNILPFSRKCPRSTTPMQKPDTYEQMVRIAEVLADDIPFVRVDFYDVDGKIYFGEMTFYPASGIGTFNPAKWDEILGSWVVLPPKIK